MKLLAKSHDNDKIINSLLTNISTYIETGKLPLGFKDKSSFYDFCSRLTLKQKELISNSINNLPFFNHSMTIEMHRNIYVLLKLPKGLLLSAGVTLITAACLYAMNTQADVTGALKAGAKAGTVFFGTGVAALTYKAYQEIVFPRRRRDELLAITEAPLEINSQGRMNFPR